MLEGNFVVFDLDNTLRKTTDDYEHTPYAKNLDPKPVGNWKCWQEFANQHGKPIERTVDLYRCMILSGVRIIILTSSAFGTKEWLGKFDIPQPDLILERDVSNRRMSVDYKKPFIDKCKHNIELWVDDCVKTCDYVESLNIPVLRVIES